LFSWEHGKTAPDGFQLARLAEEGVNVTYVLTGSREPSQAKDIGEQTLLDRYRMCDPVSRQNLIQTATLLASAKVLTGADEGHAASRMVGARDEVEGLTVRRLGQLPVRQATGVKVISVKSKYGHAAGRDIIIGEKKKHDK